MAPSIIDVIKESIRRSDTHDDKYFKQGRYVFALQGPAGEGPLDVLSGRAQFPLVINPETFEYSLPFAAEITPLQEGGVVAEEQGIVIGELTIAGTTGFELKSNRGESSWGRGDGEFTGGVDDGSYLTVGSQAVSGQMHFWRLASRCFDGYSALKKDSATAPLTKMEFHSTKEDLHLLIIPRSFTLTRSAAKERVSYRYNIRAAVVGPSGSEVFIPSPDVGWLQGFKNTISKIRSALQGIAGAVDDITAAIDEIRRTITSVAGLLDDVASFVDAFSDLADGVKKFIDIPKAFINAASNLAESAANFAVTVGLEPGVAQSFRQLADGSDRLAVAGRKHYVTVMPTLQRDYNSRTEGHKEGKDPDRDSAASALKSDADDGQGRLSIQRVYGGGVKPGDVARGRADPIQARSRLKVGKYSGFEERVVTEGDTIQSLAAKHMGDARDWPDLALANQLKAPYITDGPKLPGTLQPGSNIMVPVAGATANPDTLTTGAADPEASQAEALLGVDFELEKLADGTYGWAVDTVDGSTDARKVKGVPNLEQAVGSRFCTEQGQNILYPGIGLPRAVGQTALTDEVNNVNFEARRQLLADSRIKRLSSFIFTADQDVLSIEASVVPVGFTSDRVISRTLT